MWNVRPFTPWNVSGNRPLRTASPPPPSVSLRAGICSESHAGAAVMDEEGRTNALRHLAAFYAALDAQDEKSAEGAPGFRQP